MYNKKYFDEYSIGGKYDKVPDILEIADYIIDNFHPTTVLDIGCAFGFFVEELIDKGVKAYGIDISKYAISQANKKISPHLLVQNIEKEFDFDIQCDVILILETLEHLKRFQFLTKVNQILNTNGFLICSAPSPENKDDDSTHVTILSEIEWIKKLNSFSFTLDKDETSKIRTFLKDKQYYNSRDSYWFVFTKSKLPAL